MYFKYIKELTYLKKRKHYISNSTELEVVGIGKRATVFKIKGTEKVIKVFHPKKETETIKEVNSYLKLDKNNPFFAKMYEYGENFIVLDYKKGKTLLDCMLEGIIITEDMVNQVDLGILYAREKGLNPSDIHIKNIIWDGQNISIIDLEGFSREGKCYRWDSFKKFYKKYYSKKYFPKKIHKPTFDFFALSYRRLEKIFGFKQKK